MFVSRLGRFVCCVFDVCAAVRVISYEAKREASERRFVIGFDGFYFLNSSSKQERTLEIPFCL
jgi:hypothetical protein